MKAQRIAFMLIAVAAASQVTCAAGADEYTAADLAAIASIRPQEIAAAHASDVAAFAGLMTAGWKIDRLQSNPVRIEARVE